MYWIGFVQFQPERGDVQKNIAVLETLLAGQRADVLVLPVSGDCAEVVEIDAGKADDKQITANNGLFGERRPEYYAPDRQAAGL